MRVLGPRIAVLLFGAFASWASQADPNTSLRHPLPSGFVYPMFTNAAWTNPAALIGDKVFAFQDLFGPKILSQTQFTNEANLTFSNATFGMGVGHGYAGGNPASHTVGTGAGLKVAGVGLGFGITSPIVTQSFSPDALISIMIGLDSRVQYVVGIEHLNKGTPQLHLGVGTSRENQYSLEIDLLFPGFSYVAASGSSYRATGAAAVYAGIFGLSFETSYTYTIGASVASNLAVSQTAHGIIWIAKDWNLIIGIGGSGYANDFQLGFTGMF